MDTLIENVPNVLPMFPSLSPRFVDLEPHLGNEWMQLKQYIRFYAHTANARVASEILLMLNRIITSVLDPTTIQKVYCTFLAVPILLRGMMPIVNLLLALLGPKLAHDPTALDMVRKSLADIKQWNSLWKDYEAKSRACDASALRFTANPWHIFMHNRVTQASRDTAKKALPDGSQLPSVELLLPLGASRIISRWIKDTRDVVREVEQAVGETATIGREMAHFNEVGWAGGRIGDHATWTVNAYWGPMPKLDLGATTGALPMPQKQLAEELAIKLGHKVTSPSAQIANLLRFRVAVSEVGLQGSYHGVEWQASNL